MYFFLLCFSSTLRSVFAGHYGAPAGLPEKRKGKDGSVSSIGSAGGGCEGRNSALPHQDPGDY